MRDQARGDGIHRATEQHLQLLAHIDSLFQTVNAQLEGINERLAAMEAQLEGKSQSQPACLESETEYGLK